MHTRAITLGIAVTASLLVAACGSSSDTTATTTPKLVNYKATLLGVNERPTPNTSPGQGTFTATLDTTTGVFTWSVTYFGLQTNATLSHIHGPGTQDQAVGVILDFSKFGSPTFTPGATTGAFGGSITLNSTVITGQVTGDSLHKLMDAGLTYANVHSTQFPGGEIRGQIVKQ